MKEHINLIIDERSAPRGDAKMPAESMILSGLIIAVLLALGYSYAWQSKRVAKISAEVDNLQIQRDALRANMEQLARGSASTAQGPVQDPLTGFLGQRMDWASVIRDISWLVPDGVYLNTLDSGSRNSDAKGPGSTIKFTGTAISHAAIARFLSQLEISPRFAHVVLVFAEKNSATAGGLVGFEITGELRDSLMKG